MEVCKLKLYYKYINSKWLSMDDLITFPNHKDTNCIPTKINHIY